MGPRGEPGGPHLTHVYGMLIYYTRYTRGVHLVR